jgi:AraC-like DNA-binding protein
MSPPFAVDAADPKEHLSNLHVRGLVSAVVQSGTPAEELLGPSSFAESIKTSAWIDQASYEEMLLRALELTGDAALGLHWGERCVDLVRHPAMPLVFHAPTLRDAILHILRVRRLFATSDYLVFVEQTDSATLRLRLDVERGVSITRIHSELAMAAFVRVVRHFAGTDRAIRHVHFPYAAPAYSAEYVRFFAKRAVFEQPFAEICFTRDILDKPQLDRDEELYRTASLLVDEQLSRAMQEGECVRRVRDYLSSSAAAGHRDLSSAARAIGMSARSLRRRLSEEGTPWNRLIRDVQAALAQRLLARKDCTIQEAAHELGFADTTAFHRAFKKWTGITPLEFKHRTKA